MNIVFLFCGQCRTFPFPLNEEFGSCQSEILESYNNFIFTEEFKNSCNYKVYIATDDIHLQNTISYFGHNIGNIHILDTNFLLKNINTPIKSIETCMNEYNNNPDWSQGYVKYDGSIDQHYKILQCYNLFINDSSSSINVENCDFIIRIRPDCAFTMNILDVLKNFKENPKLEIIMGWDVFAIGKPKIMETYCTGLNNKYGKYTYQTPVPHMPPVMLDYNMNDKIRWGYAAERQLFEMIFEYCNKNNLDLYETIMSLSCVRTFRHHN